MLLDFVDVVVHVQHSEERGFYGLDRLWKDCPRIAFAEAEAGRAGGRAVSTGTLVSLRRLVLLRHGQTDHNVGAGCRATSTPSSPDGRGASRGGRPGASPARSGPADQLRPAAGRRHRRPCRRRVSACPSSSTPRLRETHLGSGRGARCRDRGGLAGRHRGVALRPRLGARPAASPASRWCAARGPSSTSWTRSTPTTPDGIVVLVAHGGLIAGLVVRAARPARSPRGPSIGGIGNCHWAALARRADHPRWRLPGYNVGTRDRSRRPDDRSRFCARSQPCWYSPTRSPSTGPQRAEPADEPGLWPNVAAAALGGRAELVAGIGWTARHAWHALTSDPRVWATSSRGSTRSCWRRRDGHPALAAADRAARADPGRCARTGCAGRCAPGTGGRSRVSPARSPRRSPAAGRSRCRRG